jgi:copper transport protein
MSRRGPRTVLLALAATVWLVLCAAPADAHAYLVGSNPADGERLDTPVRTLRLEFSEHVVLGATRLELRGSDGRPIPVTDVRVISDEADIEEPAAVTAALPELAADAYQLHWETLSSDDLHRTSGVILFGVGRSVSPGAPAVVPTRWDEALLHGSMLLALALAGGALLGTRVVPGAGRRSVLAVTALAGILSVAVLADQTIAAGSDALTVLSSGYGLRWSIRAAGLLAIAVAWSGSRRGTRLGRERRALAWLGVGLVGTGTALLGHVGASGGFGGMVAAAHVTAALAWAGAVGHLAVTLTRRRAALGVEGIRQALRSFAVPAGACLSVVVVTGLYLSSNVVASIDAALLTTYGLAWTTKIALVGLVVAAAAYNNRRLRGPRDLDLPGRGIRVEAAVLGLVLLLTGVLASSGTATDPSFRPVPVASTGQVTRTVGDLQVSAGLRPNRPGAAVVLVDVFDTRRPAPSPVSGVEVSVDGAAARPARALGDGHWTAPATLGRAGATTITVTVQRPAMPDGVSRLRWTVGGGHPARDTLVSQRPLRQPLLTAAGILAAALAVLWVVAIARRSGRRRTRSAPTPTSGRRTVGAGRA